MLHHSKESFKDVKDFFLFTVLPEKIGSLSVTVTFVSKRLPIFLGNNVSVRNFVMDFLDKINFSGEKFRSSLFHAANDSFKH